eukprot:gene39084-47550_t
MPRNVDALRRVVQMVLDKLDKGGRIAVPATGAPSATPSTSNPNPKEDAHK